MAAIDVPTFEQIATILSQLSTNYTNIFADYYNLFYNPEPMDVTIQIYDDAGNLNTITIPNRAKDKTYILNGNGDPNNSVSAPKGSVYQDLTNGIVYIKQFANTDSTGWSELMTLESFEDFIIQGAGSPEGIIAATKGVLYVDKTNATLYLKSTATGNTGWTLISADTSNLVNKDLSNLSVTGDAHFANPSLSNLSAAGTNLLNSKENASNKTATINSSSTDAQYPTAKAVYTLVTSSTSDLANKSLGNLNQTGEDKFVQTLSQVRDCIFKAPNGLPSVSGNVISLPTGTIILCANGVNSNKAVVNDKVTTASALSTSVSWTSADKGIVFFNRTSNTLIYYSTGAYNRGVTAPTGATNMIWFNPDINKYKTTSNSGSTWTEIEAAEIGRFTTNSSGAISEFSPYHPLTVATTDDVISTQASIKNIQLDINDIVTSLSGKANTNLSNVPTSKGILTESYFQATSAGASWYRVYSDKLCIQGGNVATENTTVYLLKEYKDTDYFIGGVQFYIKNVGAQYLSAKTTSSFTTITDVAVGAGTYNWWAVGYIN